MSTLLAAAPATQSAHNVELLGSIDPGGRPYLGVVGHVDPASGREFACLSGTTGTWIVETTAPASPVVHAFVSFAASGWVTPTDVATRIRNGYLYLGVDSGGGVQVVDVRTPGGGRLVRTFTTPGWSGTTDLGLDDGRGVLYVTRPAGRGSGPLAIDVATDPESPSQIAAWSGIGADGIHVAGDRAYVADAELERFLVVDVSDPRRPAVVGSAASTGCRRVWSTRDARFAVVADDSGDWTAVDLADPSVPRPIPPPFRRVGPAVRDLVVEGRVVHTASGPGGYATHSLGDPGTPVGDGWFRSGSAGGIVACYASQPSGTVYACDRERGLLLLHPKATRHLYGPATPGATGAAPWIDRFGCSYLGNNDFRIETDGAPRSSPAFLLVAHEPRHLNVNGLIVLVNTVTAPGAIIQTVTDPRGRASVRFMIPVADRHVGRNMFAQWLVIDPGTPIGVTATRGMTFELHLR